MTRRWSQLMQLVCRDPMTVYEGDIVVVQYNLIQEQLLKEEVRLV